MLDSRDGTQQRVTARVSPAGLVTIETDRLDVDDTPTIRTQAQISPLEAGIATSIELWYCDQEVSVWVDGSRVAFEQFDLPISVVTQRPKPAAYPQINITVRGTPVTLHHVQVDRDIYYKERSGSGRATGSYVRDRMGDADPVFLGDDQFFCLGDNSPMSQDSRFWQDPNPWIYRNMFDENEAFQGKVPRELMMGRAFFVYFPAVKRNDVTNRLGVPNFGDMRFIH
jgi:signal peptidase I